MSQQTDGRRDRQSDKDERAEEEKEKKEEDEKKGGGEEGGEGGIGEDGGGFIIVELTFELRNGEKIIRKLQTHLSVFPSVFFLFHSQ